VHIDLVGPLPTNRGKKILFTIIDRDSGLIEVVPLSEIGSTEITETMEET
jgi:hypothetical protein